MTIKNILKMKSLVPVTLLGIVILSGLCFAFADSTESEFLNEIQLSKKVIADQNACIDDIEATLYDFSYEISALRTQNKFLIHENKNLKSELKTQAERAANYRQEIVDYQEENYNLKRQLDQILISREIRARHQANNTELIMADNISDEGTDQEELKVKVLQTKINSIATEIEKREEAINEINEETLETFANIKANEAKVEFNISLEPSSDPSLEFNDPLVSNDVLYSEPTAAPKLFNSIEIVEENENADVAMTACEDEFSSKSPIYSMIENTNVNYNYIACRNDRYGRKIKKLKKHAKNWKYTFIQFNLESDNINLLLNKEFRLRFLSTDLNTYVNFHTDENRKKSSHYDFVYEGEPIKVSIFNEEVLGTSFDIQIFYLVDGEEYLLEDDQKQLFVEGQNVQSALASN